jgi:hypothetical protein
MLESSRSVNCNVKQDEKAGLAQINNPCYLHVSLVAQFTLQQLKTGKHRYE